MSDDWVVLTDQSGQFYSPCNCILGIGLAFFITNTNTNTTTTNFSFENTGPVALYFYSLEHFIVNNLENMSFKHEWSLIEVIIVQGPKRTRP